MFCPSCKYEYQEGIRVCPDCNEKLVDKLPSAAVPSATTPDDSWVEMGKVNSRISSDLAKGSLDSNNIPSVIMSSRFDSHTGNVSKLFGLASGSEGDIILVPREYRDEAAIILEAVLGDDLIQPEK